MLAKGSAGEPFSGKGGEKAARGWDWDWDWDWDWGTVGGALAVVYVLETGRRYLRERRLGLKGSVRNWLPVVGPLAQTLLVVKNQHRIYDFLVEERRAAGAGTFSMMGMVGPRLVMVTDPQNLEFVLNHPELFVKGQKFQRFMHGLLGGGIFNVNGDEWLLQRKLAGHIFTVRSLREMFPVFAKHGQHLLDLFEARARSSSQPLQSSSSASSPRQSPSALLLDVQDVFMRFTLDSFSEISGMGEVNSLLQPKPFAKAFDAAQIGVTERFINPLYQMLGPFTFLIPSERSLKEALLVVNQHAGALIADRKQQPGGTDLVSRYLQVDPTLETSWLRDAVTNFLLAGRDTTAVCLSWSVYELARHPSVHESLREEVLRIVGPSATPSYEHVIQEMPYMKAFISEVLRLHPSVPWDPKEAVADVTLPGGQRVPAGTVVSWVAYMTGRDPGVWPQPDTFQPMRWIDPVQYNGGVAITTYAFPAFQPGKRSCLGKQLAYAEISFVLSLLCQKGYRFSIPPHIHPTYIVSITLMTTNLLVQVTKPSQNE
ncbi:MAG: cytochrome P450 [archaeon]|nr:cytochrome P450 [archaeon]